MSEAKLLNPFEEKRSESQKILDQLPFNLILADEKGVISYINKSAIAILSNLENDLSSKVFKLVGGPISSLHGKLEGITDGEKNAPLLIDIGKEKVEFSTHKYEDGFLIVIELVREKVKFEDNVKELSNHLAKSSDKLLKTSNTLSFSAEEASEQAKTASLISEEVNAGVQDMKSNIEEMVKNINEISKVTNESLTVSNEVMDLTTNTNKIVSQLGESSTSIGDIIKVISSIAQQTNLLALNATIEAARAGDLGKGFAVVASEVKELAKQTAQSAQGITKTIEMIQSGTQNAVDLIGKISSAIKKLNVYAGDISTSVNKQETATKEFSRIAIESADGVERINKNINQVSQYANNTGNEALVAQQSANELGDIANKLRKNISLKG